MIGNRIILIIMFFMKLQKYFHSFLIAKGNFVQYALGNVNLFNTYIPFARDLFKF